MTSLSERAKESVLCYRRSTKGVESDADRIFTELFEDVDLNRVIDKRHSDTAVVPRHHVFESVTSGKRVKAQRSMDEANLRKRTCTECLPLHAFEAVGLAFVQRVVNVVTLADTFLLPGSKSVFPLDLRRIARLCPASFYAPGRFSALQMGLQFPRSRVLLFHTGRLVGTGTGGMAEARLALSMAVQSLAQHAGIFLGIGNARVINTVFAGDLGVPLDCDAFASEHSEAAHFDRSSFVGLSWRPVGYDICVEIYSTGRMNIPGAINRKRGLCQFAELLPHLLIHFTSPGLKESESTNA